MGKGNSLPLKTRALSEEPLGEDGEGGVCIERVGLIDSTAVSIFVDILVELTHTVFVNSMNITTNIETAALSLG